MTRKAITLNATAGKTTPVNNTIKVEPTSVPIANNATDKNTIPEINVPNPTKIAETTMFETTFFNTSTSAKKTNAVTNLSIILGINPAGKVVNKPDRTPALTPNKKVSLNVGNSKIPINIIVNMKSGFIP